MAQQLIAGKLGVESEPNFTEDQQGRIMKRRRWGDNDKHLWPFTFSYGKSCRTTGLWIDSGEDENPGCHLMISAFALTVIMELPPIVRPFRVKVVADSWDAETVQRMGRNWYWDESPRRYGFNVADGFLQFYHGRQTHDSDTDQTWSWFLPWTQWRFVRQSWYGPTGQHIETLWETSCPEVRKAQRNWRWEFEKTLAKVSFHFHDFDGELIRVDTNIEEREWRFGEGWFKWLSWFRKPMIHRTLELAFSKETGRKKGSWKGGTIGHAIEMLPGEMHEEAFKRYCEQHNMTFVERVVVPCEIGRSMK